MSAPANQERERFEAVYSDNGAFPKAIERRGDGYLLMGAEQAWKWWQAALSAGQATEPDAHIHLFRKIGGGRHYEQANLGGPNQNPDPEDGFEWYGSKPLYLRAAGQVIPEPVLQNCGHKHFDTKCPESGLMCGYWIRYYGQRAADFSHERDTLAKRVHDQRAEIVRLESLRASFNQPSPLVKAEALALLDSAFEAEFDLLPEDAKPLCDTFYRSLRKRLGHP